MQIIFVLGKYTSEEKNTGFLNNVNDSTLIYKVPQFYH